MSYFQDPKDKYKEKEAKEDLNEWLDFMGSSRKKQPPKQVEKKEPK